MQVSIILKKCLSSIPLRHPVHYLHQRLLKSFNHTTFRGINIIGKSIFRAQRRIHTHFESSQVTPTIQEDWISFLTITIIADKFS